MFRIKNDFRGQSILEFSWDNNADHLLITISDGKNILKSMDFYNIRRGKTERSSVFERPQTPSCLLTIYEVEKTDEGETHSVEKQKIWVAVANPNYVRVRKQDADVGGKGVMLSVAATSNLQGDCLYYMLEDKPYRYPIPVYERKEVKIFIAEVQSKEVLVKVREERPDILLQN